MAMIDESRDAPQSLNASLMREYEDLVAAMRGQLDMYETEHAKLKDELNDLIFENRDLSEKLSFELKQKMRDEHIPKIIESEMVGNLRNQLELCKREKEKLFELYQASSKLIEKLESEVRNRERCRIVNGSGTDGATDARNVALEAKLRATRDRLDMETASREQLEAENVKCQTEIAKLRLNLEAVRQEADELKEKDRKWKEKYMKMDQECTLINATLECVAKSRDDLEKKIDAYSNKIQELSSSYNEAKSKVGEALDLVERAVAERDASLAKVAGMEKEANKLHMCLKHVIDEAGKKVSEGMEEMKNRYEAKIADIMKDVPELRSELEKKTTELRRVTTKLKRLEKAATAKLDKEKISLIKGSEAEMTLLESQLDSAYKELERMRLRTEELAAEKARVDDELSKLQARYQGLVKNKEREEERLQDEVRRLQAQLQRKLEDLAEFSKRTEFFLVQIRDLQAENKNLGRLAEAATQERGKLRKTIEMKTAQVGELEEHVESLKGMNEKWKSEIRGMTDEFEERMKEVKRECSMLKKRYRETVKELEAARTALSALEKVD